MYKLYKGAFGVYPEEEDIVAVCDDNWYKMIEAYGLEHNPYIGMMTIDDDNFIDFGSWSYFVVETER